MISRHVKTLFVGAVALIGTHANVGASTPGCEEELAYYALHGTPSTHFYTRITAGQDKPLMDILKDLEEKEIRSWLSQEEKKKVRGTWLSLARQDEHDLSSRILYVGKAVKRGWSSDAALLLADLCHARVQGEQDPITQAHIALRGLAVLNVKLTEPGYDLHKKLAAVPQLTALLEDLKVATQSLPSSCGVPPFIYGDHFPEHCIPQAQVCALLTVAYGGRILVGEKPTAPINQMIYDNGIEAITLYTQALEAQTTPTQRAHYHAQIVTLTQGLARTPVLFSRERTKHLLVQKKSALALARLNKDALNDSENACVRAAFAYKTALAYMLAGKNAQALKYIALVFETPHGESESRLAIDRLRVRAEHLKVQMTDPTKVLSYECAHMSVFGELA